MPKQQLGPKPFLLPQPAVLVGSVVDGKPNYMMAAWCGMANHVPPMVSVAVRPGRHTNAGIHANGTFSLNVPSTGLVKEADYCGIVSGGKIDKSGLFTTRYGKLETAPLIEECPLNLECKLIQTVELGTHQLHLGEIVEVYAEENCLVDGVPEMSRVDPLMYSITDGNYWQVGSAVAKAFRVGKELER